MPRPTKRKLQMTLWNLPPFIVTFLHVFLSPYTKVEESFTLHAVHDVLSYGFDRRWLEYWDHVTFPGAVPRSFLPPIFLALASYPFAAVSVALGVVKTKIGIQIIIRLTLAAIFSISFAHLSKTVRYRYGSTVRAWFVLLSLSSFHIPYYAGRTIPNFLALPGVLLSFSLIIRAQSNAGPKTVARKRLRLAVILLTAAATVIRLELAAFTLPTVLSLVLLGNISFNQAITWGALGGFGSLAISSPIDYTLWIPTIPHPSLPTFTSPFQLLWPELSALHFNVVQGASADWGVMPFHYYFTNSLPKLLVGSAPLVGVAGLSWLAWKVKVGAENKGVNGKAGAGGKTEEGVEEVLRLFSLGMAALIGGMSLIGHKEWRFIIYAIPLFHLLAAFGASKLWHWSGPYPRLRPLLRLGVVGLLGVNVAATGVMTFLSMHNYPGGEVWKVLEGLKDEQAGPITIHFPSYPLQTGATLFTFIHQHQPLPQNTAKTHLGPLLPFPAQKVPEWTYSKSESEDLATPQGVWESGVDYVVTGEWYEYLDDQRREEGAGKWNLAGEVQGLDGVVRGGKFGVEAKWGRKLAILRRID